MTSLAYLRNRADRIGDYLVQLSMSRPVWQGLALVGGYWLLAAFLPFLPLYAVVSAILMAVTLSVLMAYTPGMLQSLITGDMGAGERLVIGIWIAWFGDMLLRFWSISMRGLERPEWMLTSDIVTFLIFIKLMGATLLLASPGSDNGKVPARNWISLGIAFSLGVAVAAVLLATTIGVGLISP